MQRGALSDALGIHWRLTESSGVKSETETNLQTHGKHTLSGAIPEVKMSVLQETFKTE